MSIYLCRRLNCNLSQLQQTGHNLHKRFDESAVKAITITSLQAITTLYCHVPSSLNSLQVTRQRDEFELICKHLKKRANEKCKIFD